MKRYKPVGTCIYCGSVEDLRDEHIIPKALNGDWILPDASCRACEAITSKFEGKVLRGPLWLPRRALNLKTRHPDKQPDTFSLIVKKGNLEERLQIHVDRNLPSVVLPQYATPGFLRGDEVLDGVRVEGCYVGHIQRTPEEVIADLGVDGIALEFEYPVVEFAQMIAKIAYGYAVGELGLEQIRNPLVLPAIRGLSQDVGHWVGCIPGLLPQEFKPDAFHAASVVRNNGMVMGMVSLFALQPAPLYSVLLSKGV
jgi:hypothetical protein